MVRTKDLVLVVVVLVMLLMAIFATTASRLVTTGPETTSFVDANQAPPSYSANKPSNGIDRQATIDHLRAELAKGDVIDASPSVEASPVDPETTTVATNCGVVDSGLAIARNWPLNGLSLQVRGSRRAVVVTNDVVTNGTTTVSGNDQTETIKLSLPLAPTKLAEVTCLDSEVVGVSPSGSLLFNGDAVLYKSAGSETLVGYARDGFPIYGAYGGVVDQCGGYDTPTGYRYVVSPDRNTLLGCFVATPQQFNL